MTPDLTTEARRSACREVAMTAIRITDDTTTAELEEAMRHLNQGAMDLRRKGYTGTRSTAYARQHERINAMLDDWAAAGANCRTCGRTRAVCDAEPRRCCDVCRDNGHG